MTGSRRPGRPEAALGPELRALADAVLPRLVAYLTASCRGETDVVSAAGIDEVTARLELGRRLAGPIDLQDLLSFVDDYCALSAKHNHPGFFAHQVAAADVPSMIADLVQGVTNSIPLIHELAPSASAVDRAVYSWMLAKVGWSETGTGTLTSGGSLGNLTALVAARMHECPESRRGGNPPGLVILASPSAHYSVRRAAAVMGLGESGVVPLPADALGRIDVAQVPAALRRVRERGLRPIALVATACMTGTGLYDDLAGLGAACAADGVWLHVDGAHGAVALLSPRLRHLLDGLERASSLTWDTHKMMRTSGLCTGVLVRTARDLTEPFRETASYLYPDPDEALRSDMGQRTFETTKPPLGLRLFLNLAWRGEAALRDYVEAQFEKAELLWQLMQERDDFDCPYRPQSNVLCFRHADVPGDQSWIRDRLRSSGEFYLSSTMIGGVMYLRTAIMSPMTDELTLRRLVDAVARIAQDPPSRADAAMG